MADADAPTILFSTAAEFEAWLEENHTRPGGVWLKIAKAKSGHKTLKVTESLDVALCFGWIDGKRMSLDDDFFLQSYGPRRARSTWSQINQEKVADLIEAGRMRPQGFAEIERAKKDGRWDRAYAPQRLVTVPEEMALALKNDPPAAAFYETLNKVNRFAFIFRYQKAKRPETRAKLIQQLHEGREIY